MIESSSLTVLASSLFRVDWRPDGWIHLVLGQRDDALRGPVGVLGYLLFIPLIWLVPRRHLPAFLSLTSLLWALLTLGPAYVACLLVLVVVGWFVVRLATIGPFSLAVRPHLPRNIAAALLAVGFALLLAWPQPFPLPPVDLPLYFYLHWAGIAYIFLKLYHLAIETSTQRMQFPSLSEYAAYLLFAPTLRMGPLYRFNDFAAQLRDRPARLIPADALSAIGRIVTGLLRWAVVVQIQVHFPAALLFGSPESLPYWKLVAGLYAQPLAIFLWISGNADVAVGAGRLMGFRVPENFDYPWVSTGIREFWRRWHITLGLWLKDYLFVPLGGSRRRVFVNYLVTFGFCGLWHGLYPSYFAWGISQAVGLYIDRRWHLYWQARREEQAPAYRRMRRLGLIDTRLSKGLAWLITFNYQALTIVLFMIEGYSLREAVPAVARAVLGIPK